MAEREGPAEVSLTVRNDEYISPESLAWADSCFATFPDDSETNNWGNFRDALLEVIDIQPHMFVPSSTSTGPVLTSEENMTESEPSHLPNYEPEAGLVTSYNSLGEDVSEIISYLTFEPDPSKNSLQDHFNILDSCEPMINPTDPEVVEQIEEGSMGNKEVQEEEEEKEPESLSSQVFKDDYMTTFSVNNVVNVDVSDDSSDVTQQDIFKVWDLEIPKDEDEEDWLVWQLKRALNESSTVQPVPQDSIDELIAGISDLSLTKTF